MPKTTHLVRFPRQPPVPRSFVSAAIDTVVVFFASFLALNNLLFNATCEDLGVHTLCGIVEAWQRWRKQVGQVVRWRPTVKSEIGRTLKIAEQTPFARNQVGLWGIQESERESPMCDSTQSCRAKTYFNESC